MHTAEGVAAEPSLVLAWFCGAGWDHTCKGPLASGPWRARKQAGAAPQRRRLGCLG